MSQALYTSMSGISAATTDLEVISNNVANVNTTGFKSSSVNFSDVYSTTLSYGSVASGDSGGTNPIQVGVGTQVSSISKDFSSGSAVSTGIASDLMISGSGFFTVQGTDGTTYYTRAGDFSFDDSGNLVTSDGYKVLGTSSILSSTSAITTVKVPTSIIASVKGSTDSTGAITTALKAGATTSLSELDTPITVGTFTVATVTGGSHTITLTAGDLNGDMDKLISNINTALGTTSGVTASIDNHTGLVTLNSTTGNITLTAGTSNFLAATNLATPVPAAATAVSSAVVTYSTSQGTESLKSLNNLTKSITTGDFNVSITDSSGTTTTKTVSLDTTDLGGDVNNLVAAINADLGAASPVTASVCTDGTIKFAIATGSTVAFTTPTSNASNFVTATNLSNTPTSTSGESQTEYSTKVLNYTCSVSDVTSASEATSIKSKTIGTDGSIQATYANGDTLKVQLAADGETYEFVYKTAAGVEITGANLSVSSDVAVPGNFVIQTATVTNTDGLLSVGSNLYSTGPNVGDIVYTVGSKMGCGNIKSGYLEASNVDLSDQLSNMILAQRAVEANSRVFTTSSEVMSTIVQMGR